MTINEGISIDELESAAHIAYEVIGQEYYTTLHPTSRAFDSAIVRLLKTRHLSLDLRGFSVDVGCGRTKFYEIDISNEPMLLLLDISRRMLHHSKGPLGSYRAVASAFRMSVSTASVYGVYSFLGDPFGITPFFREAYRVLRPGGRLLYISPHHLWAATLRKALGIPPYRTIFLLGTSRVFAPSIVYSSSELTSKLAEVGFSSSSVEDICLPEDFPRDEISEHILVPSRVLSVDPYQLPLLTVLEGTK